MGRETWSDMAREGRTKGKVREAKEEGSLVDIDPHNLDKEWTEHSRKVLKHGQLLADAKRKVARLKAERDVCFAELSLRVRKAPEEFGLEKVTEATVEATILTQPEYQKALRRFHDAEHDEGMHFAAVEALRHRKSGLEAMVQLWLASYFSQPKERKPAERNGRR